MQKMILLFSLGAITGMATTIMAKSLCSCHHEMSDLIKTTCKKVKNHMQSSMRKVNPSTKETLNEVVESLDSIDEETLPNKVKKTLNKVRFTLNELK